MSRPLNKFKAKRSDNGEWVSGDLMRYSVNNELYIVEQGQAYSFIPSSLSSDTGRKDNTGTEIFEGDILMLDGYKCVVAWNINMCAYCIRFSFEKELGSIPLGSWLEEHRECKVIGNIYDNPQLLNDD